MRSHLFRDIALATLFLAAGGAAGARSQLITLQPGQPSLSWLHLPSNCRLVPEQIETQDGERPQILPCGAAGSFVFGKSELRYDGSCADLIAGSEAPALIPAEPSPRLPASFPCLRGSCLGRSGDRPWVAVLDWPNEHGWSVAATVEEAADHRVDVALYDLASAGSLAQWVPGLSDAHVLVQLCAVAEGVKARPDDRPLAVNMSFGRRMTAEHCETSGPSLACALGEVLSSLAAEGIVPVAAAGNHKELLFPAASPGVVSAGALDLSDFAASRDAVPSTQTPETADALMLGYGIYLSLPAGGADAVWPEPPGASYAAALLTGWLGGTLAGTLAGSGPLPELPVQQGDRWTPVDTPSGLALARNGVLLPGSDLEGPRLLLERALGEVPIPHQEEIGAVLTLIGPAPPIPEDPLLYADGGNGPQPGIIQCVPCQGEGMPGDGGGGSVVLDLSSSQALPRQMELLGIFLRVGKSLYSFDRSRDPVVLAAMAVGSLQGLALSEVGDVFQSGEQPSLALVIRVGGSNYWHEVPIQMAP